MKKYISFRNKYGITKILSMVVCAAMSMTLIACGGNADSTKPADSGSDISQEENSSNESSRKYNNIDDDFNDSDDDITHQMKTLVKESPNYRTELKQDEDGKWIYHIGDVEVHLRTNIWDYIEFSPRVEKQKKYVSGGMTYKVDIGEIAASYGWERVSPDYNPSDIHYGDSLLQPSLLTSNTSTNNRFGLDGVEICFMSAVFEENNDDAVFTVVYFDHVCGCFAMTYDMLISSVAQLERLADYCDANGVDEINDYMMGRGPTIEWYVQNILPDLTLYATEEKGRIYLPCEE